MPKNEGSVDRGIRAILGVVILALWFVLPGSSRYFALIGLIPLITALIGWCPLYVLFKLNTLKHQ